MNKKKLILIAEDDISIRTVLSSELESKYELKLTDNCAQLWSWVSDGLGDLIILDVMMPDENGLDLIPKIKEIRPDLKIVVISAQNTILTAMQAVEKGAYEYLAKPFDITELNKVIDTAFLDSKKEENKNYVKELKQNENSEIPIIGTSPLMQKVFKSVAKLTNTDLTVMIFGESGTGKELVAKILHDHGKRKNGPFVAINMAAIPRELIESELFGHEKGSFTGAINQKSGKFEEAEGGTLFLDEIGDMPYEAQTRLLRVIQEGEFNRVGGHEKIKTNVRIITATHRNLNELVETGTFREDLFYRLNVFPINIPPLRLRISDLDKLVYHFLDKCFHEGLDKKNISIDAINELKKYKWPGNVRELENFIRRLVVLIPSKKISNTDVLKNISKSQSLISKLDQNNGVGKVSLSLSVEEHLKNFFKLHKGKLPSSGLYSRIINEVERPLISLCLTATKGNQIKASKLLGLNRNTLRKKIKDLKIKII
ncbi:MAG: Nitrogen assimilation regulatory protein [Alphaproteobacteria bacterium MarineAlpha6_Bin4]|nr:MAG: Nitrogen assimilation regulatory protein [Alphaproteobacteria bacterium MarineAlpha6_Bin4]|tara:strand:- start:821 stop:2272 length:1452 start_codon:yes stop_codon:yes gene_type:complete